MCSCRESENQQTRCLKMREWIECYLIQLDIIKIYALDPDYIHTLNQISDLISQIEDSLHINKNTDFALYLSNDEFYSISLTDAQWREVRKALPPIESEEI